MRCFRDVFANAAFAFAPLVCAAATPAQMIEAIYKPGHNPQGTNPAPIKMDVSREPWAAMPEDAFLPCFDPYGQFKWRDWPGKTKCDEDLERDRKEELRDLAAHRAAPGRDRFGGWAEGPKLEATGRFRAQKVDGKWWLVDPDGRLFWSFGPVRVSTWCGITPLARKGQPWRERMFEGIDPDGFLAKFVRDGEIRFQEANLARKYGEEWRESFAKTAHVRVKSWGMNTLANGSDPVVCLLRKTPYATRIMLSSEPIKGSDGRWGKFRDPFDPSFGPSLRAALEEREEELKDPMCIGLFADNEAKWGASRGDLARWVLASPATQPARVEFARLLAEKGIDPDGKVPERELEAFSARVAEEYFRKIRAAIKEFDPSILYLGNRFAGFSCPEWAVRIAAKHCDVMSFNIYKDSLDGWTPGEGLDVPVLIGEFHFGAHDRGLFGSGQRNSLTQEGRAKAVKRYVASALAHPLVVGAHWHQYADQPASGRWDGEHFQCGLVDICDRPYPETVQALRECAWPLYETRYSSPGASAKRAQTASNNKEKEVTK